MALRTCSLLFPTFAFWWPENCWRLFESIFDTFWLDIEELFCRRFGCFAVILRRMNNGHGTRLKTENKILWKNNLIGHTTSLGYFYVESQWWIIYTSHGQPMPSKLFYVALLHTLQIVTFWFILATGGLGINLGFFWMASQSPSLNETNNLH
jgi:hypothetical protein